MPSPLRRRRHIVSRSLTRARQDAGGVADVLQSLEELGRRVDAELTPATGTLIADTAVRVLRSVGVRHALVTDLEHVIGSTFDWDGSEVPLVPADVTEQAASMLERRRWDRPSTYEIPNIASDGESEAAGTVAAAVLASEDVPIGTIHVYVDDATADLLAALASFVDLVSAKMLAQDLKRTRASAAIAELRALRVQISPHFIHNSLTAIAGFINQDPLRARSLVSTFAEFLRASFRTEAEFTTLAEELRLVELYLELERARFGDRFEITLRVAPDVLGVRLPFLSVQPIVENAIRHGLEHREAGGRLLITVEDTLTEARVIVDDDGVGTDPEALLQALQGHRSTQHIGVLAVDERLRSAFGPEYGLVISTAAEAGTRVEMRVPKGAHQ